MIRKDMHIFIGPESDHRECLSVTNSLTDSCLVTLIDVTLACEDGNSKLVEVVTAAEVGHKVKFLFGLWIRFQGLFRILK